jgi:hypothetical protein
MPTLAGFNTFAALPEEQISEKISRRILAGDQGMLVWWSIGAGVHVEPHSHANEQIGSGRSVRNITALKVFRGWSPHSTPAPGGGSRDPVLLLCSGGVSIIRKPAWRSAPATLPRSRRRLQPVRHWRRPDFRG